MDPSSLIFVVIVAIWATYLLGHWVRRRDHVATARSVERFSEAMRVLERRPAVRSVPLSRPNPRSYVVAPAGPAPRQVTVKRAPSVSRPPAPALAAGPTAPAAARRAGRPARAAEPAGRRPAPSPVPAYLLLGLLVATPVVWVLVAATSVPAVVGVVVTLALVAVVAVLRQRARRARELARRRARTERQTASQARRDSRRAVVGRVVASHRDRAPAPSVPSAPSAPSAPSVEVAGTDVDPAEPVAARDAAPSHQDDGSWQPVPVPPPTYTLKPKAAPAPVVRRPAVAPTHSPAAAAEVVPAPADAPVVTDAPAAFDLDEILERRIAAGG